MTVQIVAEIGANACKTTTQAKLLVDWAKAAGADFVKVQAYRAEALTIDYDGEGFVLKDGIWAGRSLFGLYKTAETPRNVIECVFERCAELGIGCFASVFSKDDVDFIAQFNPEYFKIASFEANDTGLIRYAASKGKPLIISTGVVNNKEIEEALDAANSAETRLLVCTSEYPASAHTYDLGRIKFLADRFRVPVGLSDHSNSLTLPAVAVAVGAVMIEKHLCLSRDDPSPDAKFSRTPNEFAAMVAACREAEAALQVPPYKPSSYEGLKRSLYVVRDIAEGEEFSPDNVASIRPGYGMEPKHLPGVIGRKASQDLKRGTPLARSHLKAEVVEATGRGHRVFGL